MLRQRAIERTRAPTRRDLVDPPPRDPSARPATLLTPIWECYLAVLDFTSALDSGPMRERDFVDGALVEAERYVDHGTITRPEGVSVVTVENAMKLSIDFGVLRRDGARLSIGDTSARDRLARSLGLHLTANAVETGSGAA